MGVRALPLLEIGAITAEERWARTVRSSPVFFSCLVNNYWHANYKADQEGPFTCRFWIRPHAGFRPDAVVRFGREAREPLVAMFGDSAARPAPPLCQVWPRNWLYPR